MLWMSFIIIAATSVFLVTSPSLHYNKNIEDNISRKYRTRVKGGRNSDNNRPKKQFVNLRHQKNGSVELAKGVYYYVQGVYATWICG